MHSIRVKFWKSGSSPAKKESPREDHDQDSLTNLKHFLPSDDEDQIDSPSSGKRGGRFGSLGLRNKRSWKPDKSIKHDLQRERHDGGMLTLEADSGHTSPVPFLPEAQVGPAIKADKALEKLIAGENGYAESVQSTGEEIASSVEQEEKMPLLRVCCRPAKASYNSHATSHPPSPPQRPGLKNLTSFVMDDVFEDGSQVAVGQEFSLGHSTRARSLTGTTVNDAGTQTEHLAHLKAPSNGHVDHITGNWHSNDPAGSAVIGRSERSVSAELRYRKDIMRQCAGAWLESQSMLSQIHMDSTDFVARTETCSVQKDNFTFANPGVHHQQTADSQIDLREDHQWTIDAHIDPSRNHQRTAKFQIDDIATVQIDSRGDHKPIFSKRRRQWEDLVRPVSNDLLDILSDEALTPQQAAQAFTVMWEKAVPFMSAMTGVDLSEFPILSQQPRDLEVPFNAGPDGQSERQKRLCGSCTNEEARIALGDWRDNMELKKRSQAIASIVAIEEWLRQYPPDDTVGVILEDWLLDCEVGLEDDGDTFPFVKTHPNRRKEPANQLEGKRKRKLGRVKTRSNKRMRGYTSRMTATTLEKCLLRCSLGLSENEEIPAVKTHPNRRRQNWVTRIEGQSILKKRGHLHENTVPLASKGQNLSFRDLPFRTRPLSNSSEELHTLTVPALSDTAQNEGLEWSVLMDETPSIEKISPFEKGLLVAAEKVAVKEEKANPEEADAAAIDLLGEWNKSTAVEELVAAGWALCGFMERAGNALDDMKMAADASAADALDVDALDATKNVALADTRSLSLWEQLWVALDEAELAQDALMAALIELSGPVAKGTRGQQELSATEERAWASIDRAYFVLEDLETILLRRAQDESEGVAGQEVAKELTDEATDEATVRATAEAMGEAMNKAEDKAMENPMNEATDEAMDRSMHWPTDGPIDEMIKATDEAMDRSMHWPMDGPTDEVTKAMEDPMNEARDEAMERPRNDETDEATGKAMAKEVEACLLKEGSG